MTDSWTFFSVTVGAVRRVSPSFIRVTFVGSDLATFADNGYDTRIKLALPVPGHGYATLPSGPDWYAEWRALPADLRNPIRTYTAAAARPSACELDVDMVVHDDGGPASRWVASAAPGDPLVLLGPDARYDGDHGGREFRPPAEVRRLLVAGDETAVPAVTGIVSRLPSTARGEVVLEVPDAADALPLSTPDGVRVTWVARDGVAPYGALLVPAVQRAAASLLAEAAPPAVGPVDLEPVDNDEELLWEVPEQVTAGDCYAWLAGEAGAITTLRRHLVKDLGWDRKAVAFMGYWRVGRAESS